MKAKRLTGVVGLLVILLFLSGCGTEIQDGWALYLRPDATPAIELDPNQFERWSLRRKPFLTASDLVSYDWASHVIVVTQESYARVEGLFDLPIGIGGIPFVVCVGKDRIYAGAFWSPATSFFYQGVVINQPFDDGRKAIKVSFTGENPAEDPRSDPRIWQALFQENLVGQGEEVVAFVNVNLVPMTSEIVVEDQTVLVAQGKIIAVEDSEQLTIPEGTQVIDGEDAYLMPGLADMHMHTRQDWDDKSIWPVQPLNLYLANGVTTIRDMGPQGDSLTYTLEWRDEIAQGTRIGPTIFASGMLLYASPLSDPPGIVRQNHDQGFDFLKLYSYLSKEDYSRAMTEAKVLGMYTTGHIPYAVGLEEALSEGLDEVAHIEELLPEFFDIDREVDRGPEQWLPYIVKEIMAQTDLASPNWPKDFFGKSVGKLIDITSLLHDEDVPVCTTLVIDDVIQQKLFESEAFLARSENRYFEAGYLDQFLRGEEKHQQQCAGIEQLCALKYSIDLWILRGLDEKEVLLLLGTDSGTGGMGIVPGFSIHDELQILVENGFSPYEAIAAGTINAAAVVERMGDESNFGTIEVGNRADLVLVSDNPLEDIATIRFPLGVMSAGRWFSREDLDQLTDLL